MVKLPRNFYKTTYMMRVGFPILGAASLFWSAYTARIPMEITPLIGVLDAGSIIGSLSIYAAVAFFFAKVFKFLVYYLLTSIWDTIRAKPGIRSDRKLRAFNFWLNYARSFIRRYDIYFDVILAVLLFSRAVLGVVYLSFLLKIGFVFLILWAVLRVFHFRTPKEEALALFTRFKTPHGVSLWRLSGFKLQWAVMSFLFFSWLFGNELARLQSEKTVCLDTTQSQAQRAAIFLTTNKFLIMVAKEKVDQYSYAAIPIEEVQRIQLCLPN